MRHLILAGMLVLCGGGAPPATKLQLAPEQRPQNKEAKQNNPPPAK